MRLLEASDLVSIVGILPAVAHFSRLWSPEIHSPGAGNSGICVACRKFEARLGAHERIHIFRVIFSSAYSDSVDCGANR